LGEQLFALPVLCAIGFGKIKQAKQSAVLGEKQVPIALGEPLERWGASAGWVQTLQRSVPIFLLFLSYEFRK
jgi:hypothetical protein